MIEFVIQTLPLINFTTKPTLTSDLHSSVHGYAQEHTSIYIYIKADASAGCSEYGFRQFGDLLGMLRMFSGMLRRRLGTLTFGCSGAGRNGY